jgi:Flp pilus assembly protein TadG
MVEHAIAIPVFLCLLLVTFDSLRVCYIQLTLQYTLTRVAHQIAADPVGTPKATAQSKISAQLSALGVSLVSQDILTVCPAATFNTTTCPVGDYQTGESQDLVTYRLTKPVELLSLAPFFMLKSTNVVLSATVMGRNEPV